MTVTIRYRHNRTMNTISEEKLLSGSAITGNTIPAKLANGEYGYKEFGGVISIDSPWFKKSTHVKLVNIEGFSWSSGFGEWITISKLNYILGVYLNNKFYIAIQNDLPIEFSLSTNERFTRNDSQQ